MNARFNHIALFFIFLTLGALGCAAFDASGDSASDDKPPGDAGIIDTGNTETSDADGATESHVDIGDSGNIEDSGQGSLDDSGSGNVDDGSGNPPVPECTSIDDCTEGYTCNTAEGICVPSTLSCDLTDMHRPLRCDDTDFVFGPASRVTAFEIAAEDCCFDVNGDGALDNIFSLLNINSPQITINIQDNIDSGNSVLILEHDGIDDIINSSPYTLNMWLGESFTSPAPAALAIDPISVDHGTFPLASLPNAKVENGVLTAGPGVVDIKIPLFGPANALHHLRIRKARIEATLDPASSLEEGIFLTGEDSNMSGAKLGGAIHFDDFTAALNEPVADCACLGLNGVDLFLPDGSCTALSDNTCQAQGNSACADLVAICLMHPMLHSYLDVDTDDDGTNDALSIGVLFSTDATKISGVSN